jgi:hypothetical protein
VDEAQARKKILDEAARDAGREPLVFSVMLTAVLARDSGEVRERLREVRSVGEPVRGVVGTSDEIYEALRTYERAGVKRVFLQQAHHEDLDMIAIMGEVATALK